MATNSTFLPAFTTLAWGLLGTEQEVFGHQWHCCHHPIVQQSHSGTVWELLQVTQSSDFTAWTTLHQWPHFNQYKDLVRLHKIEILIFLAYKSAHLKFKQCYVVMTHRDCSISHLLCYNSYLLVAAALVQMLFLHSSGLTIYGKICAVFRNRLHNASAKCYNVQYKHIHTSHCIH